MFDFNCRHSEFLAGLQTWSSWLCITEESNKLQQLLDFCVPILRNANTEPPVVCHAAAHLFLNLSGNIFPPSMITLPHVVEFLHASPNLCFNNKQTKDVVNNAFCNILVRPWGDLSISDANKRLMLINTFFDALTKEFRELTPSLEENKVKGVVCETLTSLCNIVEHCKNNPQSSKKLLYSGLKV